MANPTIVYGADSPEIEMYDPTGTLVRVKSNKVEGLAALGWSASLPTLVVTGTAIAGGVAEAEIVTGGETLILTLTNGTWDTDVLAQLQALSAPKGFNGSVAGGTGWDAQVMTADWTTAGVRTSNTVITWTSPAAASYALSGDETVTFEIPANLVRINGVQTTTSGNLVCSPTTFVITNS